MSYVASLVKRFKESPKGTQDVIQDATTLIVEGAIIPRKSFFLTSKNKAELRDISQKLNVKYLQINIQIGFRVLTAMECKGRSPLSKKYPTHAVGIEKSMTEVLDLLEIENDQNAVTVILHGFGGMGRTTLADWVVSEVGGCRYSKVRLFVDIESTGVIEKLQKQLLENLMEPGQPELGERLEKVQAFIYIDNVLNGDTLKKLLPQDMSRAKKVRLLLTARDENLKNAYSMPCTEPKINKMEGIQEGLIILKKEIKDVINYNQFNDIIHTCGGIPLMLTLRAPFIGHAKNKEEAYSTLVLKKDKWPSEAFEKMRYAFAYDALPPECKDPFLDLCSFFKGWAGWAWDSVEDIVGKDKLGMLESRALVIRTTNGVSSVHDVIFILYNGMQSAHHIKDIWLSGNKDALEISADTLDLMHKSLRVLQLGKLAKVEGKYSETLKELVFLKRKFPSFRFIMCQS